MYVIDSTSEEKNSQGSNSSVQKPRILIVDDEPDIGEFLADFFKRKDYSTLQVFNGEDALVQLNMYHPHVILLYIFMPDMGR
ncbi:MAG: response regulator [Candidatus Electryonea clarkiae]|nr:response regulator [Candidatus Electryonea clarkiae]